MAHHFEKVSIQDKIHVHRLGRLWIYGDEEHEIYGDEEHEIYGDEEHEIWDLNSCIHD